MNRKVLEMLSIMPIMSQVYGLGGYISEPCKPHYVPAERPKEIQAFLQQQAAEKRVRRASKRFKQAKEVTNEN